MTFQQLSANTERYHQTAERVKYRPKWRQIPAVEGVNWHHLIEFLAMNNANRDRIEQAMKALIRHGWVANVRWKDLLLKLVAPTVSPTERFAYTHTLSYMADCAISARQ